MGVGAMGGGGCVDVVSKARKVKDGEGKQDPMVPILLK